MISNSISAHNLGQSTPSPSIPKGTIINNLVTFIEKTLIEFQDFYVNSENDSEEEISQFVVNFFTALSKSETFIFCKESIQKPRKGHARRADFGVFMHHFNRNPFYTIEAKRLPTPTKAREREYVVGNDSDKPSGGIERYKRNLHGIGISESAIIAYVHKNNFSYWYTKINEWIDELILNNQDKSIIWDNNDKLNNQHDISPDKLCQSKSSSLRNDGSNISLLHYFISINSSKN